MALEEPQVLAGAVDSSHNAHLGLGPGRSRWAAPCPAGSVLQSEAPNSAGTWGHMAPYLSGP